MTKVERPSRSFPALSGPAGLSVDFSAVVLTKQEGGKQAGRMLYVF
jgi:hypothetical protein